MASEAVQTICLTSAQELSLGTTVDRDAVLVAIQLAVSSSSWSYPVAAVSIVILIPRWLRCWSYSVDVVVPIPRWLWCWSYSVVLVVTGRLWGRPDTGRPHR